MRITIKPQKKVELMEYNGNKIEIRRLSKHYRKTLKKQRHERASLYSRDMIFTVVT